MMFYSRAVSEFQQDHVYSNNLIDIAILVNMIVIAELPKTLATWGITKMVQVFDTVK